MVYNLLTDFITFITVIDPIGTIPVFIAVTATATKSEKQAMARKSALIAALVLIFFVVAGELILNAINVPLSTFQIAGGIILFLFALTMLFGESKADKEMKQISGSTDKAVFPLAMPSLASPGAILAAILLTENSKHDLLDQLFTSLTMLAVMFIAWLFMALSTRLFKYIGNSGASVISRIMGLILSAVAVANVLAGFKEYFRL